MVVGDATLYVWDTTTRVGEDKGPLMVKLRWENKMLEHKTPADKLPAPVEVLIQRVEDTLQVGGFPDRGGPTEIMVVLSAPVTVDYDVIGGYYGGHAYAGSQQPNP
jgi:hypothetical protein